MKKIVYYKWGEYKGPEEELVEEILEDIDEGILMKLNSNHMNSFSIRDEDKDKTFYADPECMDIDEEGISIKLAYAVGPS